MRSARPAWSTPGGIRTAAFLGVFAISGFVRAVPATADDPAALQIDRILLQEAEVPTVPTLLVLKFGDFVAAPAQPAQGLDVGDELLCPDVRVAVRLTSPGTDALVNLRGPFRVAFAPRLANGTLPVINLLGGEVHVQSGQPTTVQAGEVVIGSRGTAYGVRVSKDGQTPTLETFVFDGRVAVGLPAGPMMLTAATPAAWLRLDAGIPPAVEAVPEVDVQATARLYATLDVAAAQLRSKGIDEKEAAAQLTADYQQVFSNPTDARARLNLAEQKVRLDSPQGVAYQLRRVDVTPQRNPQLWFDKAQLQVAIDDTQGLDVDAFRRAFEQASRSGPTRVQRLLPEDKRRRLDGWNRGQDTETRVVKLVQDRQWREAIAAARGLEGNGRASTYLSLLYAAVQVGDDVHAREFGALAMQRDVAARDLSTGQQRGLLDLWQRSSREGPTWPPPEAWGFRLLEVGLAGEAVSVFEWLASRTRPTSRTHYGLGLARQKQLGPRALRVWQRDLGRALELAREDHLLSPAEVAQVNALLGRR